MDFCVRKQIKLILMHTAIGNKTVPCYYYVYEQFYVALSFHVLPCTDVTYIHIYMKGNNHSFRISLKYYIVYTTNTINTNVTLKTSAVTS